MPPAFNPVDIEVFVGIDMAKGDHYSLAITRGGIELFDRPVANDEVAISDLIERARHTAVSRSWSINRPPERSCSWRWLRGRGAGRLCDRAADAPSRRPLRRVCQAGIRD